MARDYVKKRQAKPASSGPKHVLSLLFCFLLGYLTATVFDYQSLTNWVNKTIKKSTENKPNELSKAPPKVPVKPKFEFYTLLSKDNKSLGFPTHEASQKMPAPVATNTTSAPVRKIDPEALLNAKNTETAINKNLAEGYLIQVAAFNRRQDAEKLKATLVLRGFDVGISNIEQKRMTWYRVVIGPFASRADAEKAQVSIAQNDHIKGMIKKVEG